MSDKKVKLKDISGAVVTMLRCEEHGVVYPVGGRCPEHALAEAPAPPPLPVIRPMGSGRAAEADLADNDSGEG